MMIKKVLFCATIDIHFQAFHLPYLKWFKEQGWEVHVAACGDIELPFVDKKYNLPFQRSPFSLLNIKAYKELKAIMEKNHYQLIHCHTPMGGVIARLAARRLRKTGTKVLYTVHGFHFCNGAPITNWLLYYPIERFLSYYTDCLITINLEDYQLAKHHQFKAKLIAHVHGVGVNTDLFYPVGHSKKTELRLIHGFGDNDFLMFYAAEFNTNKNQQFLIKALALIKDELPDAKLLLAGDGPLLEECRRFVRFLGVEDRVHFLGYRNDIQALLKISDIAVASSLREGLPVNIMEALASGLPIVAIDNRGHRELIQNGVNGWVINNDDIKMMAEKMRILAEQEDLKNLLGNNGRKMIENKYEIDKVLKEMRNIYLLFMEETEEYRWAVH
ncbi:MAG TPA: glycosyltransferase family 4 protein [Neobacillus sp.]